MFARSGTASVRKNVRDAAELALQLAEDKKFQARLLSAAQHLTEAQRRVQRGRGLTGTARRLAADQALQSELRDARRDLQQAYAQVNAKRRGHRLRIAALAALASLGAVPQVRERVSALLRTATRNRRLQGVATAAVPGRDDARPNSLDDLTKEELYARAQEAEIPGRSEMSKDELVTALRAKG